VGAVDQSLQLLNNSENSVNQMTISRYHMRPYARYVLLALVGFKAAAALAAHDQPSDPNFSVPRAELMATVKTIGIMPITVVAEVPDADGVAARYEAEIVSRVTGAGFSVVPPSVMRETRERIKTALGGIYDPMTGLPIKEKFDTLNKRSRAEYLASHRVDALLEAAIIRRAASFSFDEAKWDGVTDSSSGRSGLSNFMTSMSGVRASGEVPALSFAVRLTGIDGKPLYRGIGGLQVLGYARVGVHNMLATVRQRDINSKFIMTDPARDARALSLALDPLLRGSTPAPINIASVRDDAPAVVSSGLKIARDELLQRFQRLALAPLTFQDIGVRDDVRIRYREALTQKLTQQGFSVVGGEDYGRLWDAEQAAAGGYFDPLSGKLDAAKMKASRARVFQSMQEHEQVTAVVVPKVVDRLAVYASGAAEWDGVMESLTPGKGSFAAIFDPSMSHGGHLTAISLEVQFIDPSGELLFEGIGGIQLTEGFPGDGTRTLPETELFSNPGNDKRAVDAALGSLAAPGKP
jgi:hypothetical protein